METRGLLEEGDLEEAVVTAIIAGDSDDTWFDPTLHGTAQQRLAALAIGYSADPSGCTSANFFNASPDHERDIRGPTAAHW